jgi:hypothetical protein
MHRVHVFDTRNANEIRFPDVVEPVVGSLRSMAVHRSHRSYTLGNSPELAEERCDVTDVVKLPHRVVNLALVPWYKGHWVTPEFQALHLYRYMKNGQNQLIDFGY